MIQQFAGVNIKLDPFLTDEKVIIVQNGLPVGIANLKTGEVRLVAGAVADTLYMNKSNCDKMKEGKL